MRLIDSVGKFKVIKCKCGFVSVTSAMKVFKCFSCKKSYLMTLKPTGNNLTRFNVKILFHTDNAIFAGNYVREYKKQNSNEKLSDFHTYKY